MMKKVNNVPVLRFFDFDKYWEIKEVGAICDFIVPGRNKPKSFNGNIPWITTPDITHNDVIISSKKGLEITKEEAKFIGSKIVPQNSIVISCVGDLGLVAVTGKEIVINQQLHAFIPHQEIHFRFLLYALSIRKDYMERIATKTAVPYMNKTNCNSIPISFPTLPEQQKIASFLTAVDNKIRQDSKKKILLERYKKGVMQQLFSREIRFKDAQGNLYPDWKEKKLGDVGEIIGGGTPETRIEGYWSGNIHWFTPTELKTKYVSSSKRQITKAGLLSSSAKLLPLGTILVSTRATVGDVAIALVECCTNQGFQSIIVNRQNINEFLYYWLILNKHQLLRKASGSTFLEINKTEISKLKIHLPSILEQTKIANFLSAIDDKINLVSRQLKQTRQYKKGLLQQMFV